MFKDPYNDLHWEHGEDWQNARRGKRECKYITHSRVSFEGWAAAGVAVAAGSAIAGGVEKATAGGDEQSAAAKRPKIVPAQFGTPTDSINQYVDLYNTESPYLQTIADQQNSTANAKYQQSLAASNPSILSSIATQGSTANDLLNGRIPQDVSDQVQRSSAYQALMGQGSTDSGSAHALTARDFGTTTLGLQQQGSALLSQSLQNTKALNPYQAQATDLLYTPQQLLARSDSNAAYTAAVANGNAQANYANALNAAAANSYNPLVSGLTSGAGALSSALTGPVGQQLSNAFGSGSSGGSYTTPGSNSYDQGSAYASGGGYYNPYLDTNNYSDAGDFIGNADSFGG